MGVGEMKTPVEFFAECPVPHMIIGGHAVRAYGYARQTVDFDCMVAVHSVNELSKFLRQHDYTEVGRMGGFVRYHCKDRTIGDLDVMPVNEETFGKMLQDSRVIDVGSLKVRVPKPLHLIALKLHAIKNNGQREMKDGADIIEILRIHGAEIPESELAAMCKRYAPPGFFERLQTILKQ